MSSHEESNNVDPQKIYLSRLVMACDDLREMIFVRNATAYQILDAMEGIISFLDANSQKALETQSKQIRSYQQSVGSLSPEGYELRKLYTELMAYLHTTYLQEINRYAKPKENSNETMGIPI